jgi:hypothetical protein
MPSNVPIARLIAAFVVVAILSSAVPPLSAAQRFHRGDSNTDGSLDITDAIRTLGYLFLGKPSQIPCQDAADATTTGR